MGKHIDKFYRGSSRRFGGEPRFQHWYADNQVYFITARCRDRTPAFRGENAKAIVWDRLLYYAKEAEFFPWIVSLLPNHYHILGYNRHGEKFPKMMQRFHGSVAKLVNDTLDVRLKKFWWDSGDRTYFDGCIRNEIQCRRTYAYIQRQAIRHKLTSCGEVYPHTRRFIELKTGLRRAHELGAFLEHVPYKRYLRKKRRG